MTSFSTEEILAIKRNVSVSPQNTNTGSLAEDFEIEKCTKWITENFYQKVCLQFPDNALYAAHQVAEQIRNATDAKIFILADTSYASCCIDGVAAAHVEADSLIHFGPACLTPHRGIPVLHVYQKASLDVDHFYQAIRKIQKRPVYVFYETQYHRYLSDLKGRLAADENVAICELNQSREVTKGIISGRRVPENSSPECAVFIGSESMLLANLVLSFKADTSWFLYEQGQLKEHPTASNKFLMKRLHLVEKLKDAEGVGILVGTLSVEGTLAAVDRIKNLCKKSGKKSYTVAVGRPNVAKLANFPEIDVFVLVSCPENKLLVETSEFYQPIVSLQEVELALGGRTWSPDYSLDFRDLQPGGRLYSEETVNSNGDEADVSLLTGKVRYYQSTDTDDIQPGTELVAKNLGPLVERRGAQFLSERSWSGLTQRLGETSVEKAAQGRSGIPLGYEDEGSASTDASSSSGRKLKLLCLHGYRQDASKLRQQTGALRKTLKGVADLEFLSAPFSVPTEGETSRAWWFTKQDSFNSRDDSDSCTGLEESLELVETHWKTSNFDGLLGFSQGACLVGLIAAMVECGLVNFRPNFVVLVAGFRSRCKAHVRLYPSLIKIPSLHVFGETDQVIPCEWAEELAGLFENASVIQHPGGHFVPGNSSLKLQYHEFLKKQQGTDG